MHPAKADGVVTWWDPVLHRLQPLCRGFYDVSVGTTVSSESMTDSIRVAALFGQVSEDACRALVLVVSRARSVSLRPRHHSSLKVIL